MIYQLLEEIKFLGTRSSALVRKVIQNYGTCISYLLLPGYGSCPALSLKIKVNNKLKKCQNSYFGLVCQDLIVFYFCVYFLINFHDFLLMLFLSV